MTDTKQIEPTDADFAAAKAIYISGVTGTHNLESEASAHYGPYAGRVYKYAKIIAQHLGPVRQIQREGLKRLRLRIKALKAELKQERTNAK